MEDEKELKLAIEGCMQLSGVIVQMPSDGGSRHCQDSQLGEETAETGEATGLQLQERKVGIELVNIATLAKYLF